MLKPVGPEHAIGWAMLVIVHRNSCCMPTPADSLKVRSGLDTNELNMHVTDRVGESCAELDGKTYQLWIVCFAEETPTFVQYAITGEMLP